MPARLKALTLAAFGSFLCFAAYIVVPPIGLFSGLFAPFPVACSRIAYGRAAAFVLLMACFTAITGIFGLFFGFLYIAVCGITGMLIPELLLRGVASNLSIYSSAIANFGLFFACMLLYGNYTGINLHQFVSAEITGSLKQALSIYESAGIKGEELDFLKHTMTTVADIMKKLYPAMLAWLFILISISNLQLLRRYAGRVQAELKIEEFKTFKNADALVWLIIIAGFSLLVPLPQLYFFAVNILSVAAFLYFFQGLAVVLTFIDKSSYPSVIKVVFYVSMIIQPYIFVLIAIIGLFDLWGNFRSPKKIEENL